MTQRLRENGAVRSAAHRAYDITTDDVVCYSEEADVQDRLTLGVEPADVPRFSDDLAVLYTCTCTRTVPACVHTNSCACLAAVA